MPTFHELTTAQLKQALHLREQIEALQGKLSTLLGGTAATTASKQKVSRPKGRRTMSAAGRAKIAAAQKARWAKVRGKTAPAKAAKPAAPKKPGMSVERREKLAAAMKARWAARKKAAAASAE